ncbi:MAG: hypothetical protein JWM69_1653 [Candidatus Binatus sp.]|nr:hypothetical protein [Candidatus Binatus sp.]
MTDTTDKIRALAQDRKLSQPHTERWLAMDETSRARMLELALNLRMRTGQIAATLDTLAEIAVREQTTVAEVMARDEINRAIGGHGSAPSRARALLDSLRQIRYPQLHREQERLRTEIAALKLPRGISVDLPRELGSDELTVSIAASTGADLCRMIDALHTRKSELARIVAMLGGKDDDREERSREEESRTRSDNEIPKTRSDDV